MPSLVADPLAKPPTRKTPPFLARRRLIQMYRDTTTKAAQDSSHRKEKGVQKIPV